MKKFVYSHLPGWSAERRVVNGCGGHVVLLDRDEAPTIKGTDRWCITHLPSGNSRCFPSKRKAMEALRTLAVGVDNDWDILPFGETSKITTVELVEEAGITKRTAAPEMPSSSRISAVLNEEFPDDEIVSLIRDLLTAEKPDSEGALVPDWTTRRSGLQMLLSYRNGMPLKMEMIIHRNEEVDDNTIIERMAADPTYRDAMIGTLQSLLQLSDQQKSPTPPPTA